jgi:hypothetical protein
VLAVERTYKLDRGKSILVVVIPLAVLFLIAMVMVVALGVAFLTLFRHN